MSKFSDAAVTIKKAAVKYEQMVALAAMLDEIGSLEQIATESQTTAIAAREDATKAKDEAKKAKDKLAELKAQADALVISAQDHATTVIRAAEERAAEIEKSGQDKADALVLHASMEVNAIASGNEASAASARASLSAIAAERDAMAKDCEVKRAELDRIEKAMADAKKKLAALIG